MLQSGACQKVGPQGCQPLWNISRFLEINLFLLKPSIDLKGLSRCLTLDGWRCNLGYHVHCIPFPKSQMSYTSWWVTIGPCWSNRAWLTILPSWREEAISVIAPARLRPNSKTTIKQSFCGLGEFSQHWWTGNQIWSKTIIFDILASRVLSRSNALEKLT